MIFFHVFFNATATTEIYTLSLHDALPIFRRLVVFKLQMALRGHVFRVRIQRVPGKCLQEIAGVLKPLVILLQAQRSERRVRSEEHTSELQSRQYLVCRLLLEKKN